MIRSADRRAARVIERSLAALATAVLATVWLPGRPATGAPDPLSAENQFVAAINDVRASFGLRALVVDRELTSSARRWTVSIANDGDLSHNAHLPSWVKADWEKLAENVGLGSSVAAVHDAMLDSPTHRSNILDPDFTHVGVGVVMDSDGTMFTAHNFMALRSPRAQPPARPPRPAVGTTRPRRGEPALDGTVARRHVKTVLEQLRELDTAL